MKKPKYYLKPWAKGDIHRDYIRKKTWNKIRKENVRPEADFEPLSRTKWYTVKDSWHIRERYLTQRLFIEQKEPKPS